MLTGKEERLLNAIFGDDYLTKPLSTPEQNPAPAPRCYISGEISGLPIEQAAAAFDLAEWQVEAMGCQPVNPMKLPHNHGKTWQDYMKEDIAALCTCDLIYMLKGWEKSRGACVEYDLAENLGIKIEYQRIT